MGGRDNENSYLDKSELYDPATGIWSVTGALVTARLGHTTTLLLSGQVLVAGGDGIGSLGAEVYDVGQEFLSAWQPTLNTISSPLVLGHELIASGNGFCGYGFTEASGGGFNNSASNYPLVQLRRMDNEQTIWLSTHTFSDTALTTLPTTEIAPGYAQVTIFVNGIPSAARILVVKPNWIYLPMITKNP